MLEITIHALARPARRLATGCVALSVAVAPARAQGTFTLGSTAQEVRRAQGIPTVIERLGSLGVEIWTYGAASVRFSAGSLRVAGWENSSRSLRVHVRPGADTTASPTFGAGSHQDDVVRLMGTPTAVRNEPSMGIARWRYGPSSVIVAASERRVITWENGGNLKVAGSPPTQVVAAPHDTRGSMPNARRSVEPPPQPAFRPHAALEPSTTQPLSATSVPAPIDPSATTSSAPVRDEVERDLPRSAHPNPEAIAIVIGVERYATLPQAQFAARDAQLFRRYAISTLGVRESGGRVYMRTDAAATGSEFRKLFSDNGWLARRVNPASDVYVFFSGHGADDPGTGAPYLLPSDADGAYPGETGYALATLYDQLARLDVRSITVFLDARFTGATRSAGAGSRAAGPIVISVEHPALLRDNFAVFIAAGGRQFASDYPDKRYGLFTYFTLLGLRGNADADGDRAVTVAELERYLAVRVAETATSLDREQMPLVIARGKDRAIVRLRGAP